MQIKIGKNINKAFTLAEILLVLSVIGVVAALTIPSLIQKINNDQYVAALKRAYSNVSQAYTLLLAENGGDISSVFAGDGSASADANTMNAFALKLNLIKNCGNSTGCWYDTPLRYLNGANFSANFDSGQSGNYGKAILADGSLLIMNDMVGVCSSDYGDGPLDNSVCGAFFVDINGNKPPNVRGRDFFVFWIAKNGVYPLGLYNDGYSCGAGSDLFTGDGCAAKVLQEGAMNY